MNLINRSKRLLGTQNGLLIILSLIVEKVTNFLLMIVVARLMSIQEFGSFSFVKSIVSSVLPFGGMGGNHALLRYGTQLKSLKHQYALLFSTLFYGVIFSLALIFIAYVIVGMGGFFDENSKLFFEIFVFYILSYYIFDLTRNFFRLVGQNNKYALHGIAFSFVSLLLGMISLFFFSPVVFLISLTISPLISVLFINVGGYKNLKFDFSFQNKFWKYGFFVGLGVFFNQFFLQADIIILGFTNADLDLIAKYKIASLSIYTFFLIPNSFLIRDFTTIAKKSDDYLFLRGYLEKYLKYSVLILSLFAPFFYFSSAFMIETIFSPSLLSQENVQNILLIAFLGGVILRIPFGNMLNAVGKAKWNVWNAFFSIVLTSLSLFYFVKEYGILGAAYVMAFMYCFSGLIAMFLFIKYMRYHTDYKTVSASKEAI